MRINTAGTSSVMYFTLASDLVSPLAGVQEEN